MKKEKILAEDMRQAEILEPIPWNVLDGNAQVPILEARELWEMKLKSMSGILHLAADEELKALKEEKPWLDV